MRTRAFVPLLLNVVLVLGMALLAWRKLVAWRGLGLQLGVGVSTAYVCWTLWELRTSLRDSRAQSVRSDRGTLETYAIAQGTTALSVLALETHWPCEPSLFIVSGAVLFACGAVLRITAVRELGRFYSHRVQVTDDHRVVQTGPYKWLRHPAYSGMLLGHLGLVLVFFNWISFILMVGTLVPALLVRIILEEKTLSSLPSYAEFCAGRARIIPYVW